MLSVSIGSGKKRGRFRWQLAALMLCAGFVLSLSTLIFKAFAIKDEFWSTAFWMFAGEALFGAGFLCIRRYRRQFIELCRSNGKALLGINASNELINLGGGLANRYALIFAPLALVQARGLDHEPLRVLVRRRFDAAAPQDQPRKSVASRIRAEGYRGRAGGDGCRAGQPVGEGA